MLKSERVIDVKEMAGLMRSEAKIVMKVRKTPANSVRFTSRMLKVRGDTVVILASVDAAFDDVALDMYGVDAFDKGGAIAKTLTASAR